MTNKKQKAVTYPPKGLHIALTIVLSLLIGLLGFGYFVPHPLIALGVAGQVLTIGALVLAIRIRLCEKNHQQQARNDARKEALQQMAYYEANARLHTKMALTLTELQTLQQENLIISKMNERMHTCDTPEALYQIIRNTAVAIFPAWAGTLALYNKPKRQMEVVLHWGGEETSVPTFPTRHCHALKNKAAYDNLNNPSFEPCAHTLSPFNGAYIEIPLIVRQIVVGLLIFQGLPNEAHRSILKRMMSNFSEDVKLGLVNMNLRTTLKEQALHDGLTGIFNRRYLDETLPRELERVKRNKTELVLAILDVDNFKEINDTYGHQIGDKLLQSIGSTCHKLIRAGDVACRYGGDEFVIVLVDTRWQQACERFEQINAKLSEKPAMFHGKPLPAISLSIGIAVSPMHGITVDELMRSADDALYQAKNKGKNCIVVSEMASFSK